MKPSFKTVLRGVLATGIVAALTGCLVVKVTVNGPKESDSKGKKSDGNGTDTNGLPPPSIVTGSLAVPIGLFTSGSGADANCFPASQGWDKFYIIITNFIGKNVTPTAFSFTNKAPKQTNFTVKTCNPHNGTTMETGIVTFDMFNPATTRVCVTNAGAACLDNGNLSMVTRTMGNAKTYRAIVFYKSGTVGTNQTIKVDFSYP